MWENLHSMLLPKLVWELMAVRWLTASGKYEHTSQLLAGRHIHLWICAQCKKTFTTSTFRDLSMPQQIKQHNCLCKLAPSLSSVSVDLYNKYFCFIRVNQFNTSLSAYSAPGTHHLADLHVQTSEFPHTMAAFNCTYHLLVCRMAPQKCSHNVTFYETKTLSNSLKHM